MLEKPKKRKKNKRPNWNKELWDKVYERDNFRCQMPNCMTPHQLDYPHHIKYRSQGGEDIEENLITLCITCHALVHSSKKKYKPILEEIIRVKYN